MGTMDEGHLQTRMEQKKDMEKSITDKYDTKILK